MAKQSDLDEILRNIQRRVATLFGRSGGSGSAVASPASVHRGLSIGLIVLALLWLASGIYRVDAQEKAVILRFGQYVQTTGPGYNWHLPWPIERDIVVNVSRLYSVTDDTSMLTADTNLVEVKSAVQYTQPDPLKLLFRVRDVEETLAQVSESAMREAVGQASLDRALAKDPSINERAQILLQQTLNSYDLGVHILSVKLTDVMVPEAVQDAQRDVLKADRDGQRIQKDAEGYRNDVLPRARGAAAKEVLDAEAYRLQVLALAQGQTARFDQVLTQYEHSPVVTRERMYLDTMENVYKNSRKVIVDTKSGNMMYLPLDKLILGAAQTVTLPNDTMTVAPARLPDASVPLAEDPARARGVR